MERACYLERAANMSKIKPIFKYVSEADKMNFVHSDCLLTISVGQESHENQRFAATIDLINTTFYSCTIMLHDSLQRYTIALDKNHDADYYHEASVEAGDRWLARNGKFYKDFHKKPNIIRWDTWLNDPDFIKSKNQIITTIQSNVAYKSAFDTTIDEYLTRYCKRLKNPSSFNRERARQLCFDYLIEECAVLCLWPKTGCHFELYAGKHNAAMEKTWKHFVAPISPNLVRSIMIGFNRRPDLQPQRFDIHQSVGNNSVSESTGE